MNSSPRAIDDRRGLLHEEAAGWRFFHDLFRLPTPDQWRWLNQDRVKLAWKILNARVTAGLTSDLPLPTEPDQYEQDFLAAFEVGAPKPPCPLIESHWNRRDNPMNIIHENMLYYRHFGLSLDSTTNESADHLRHQLEFMFYLCQLEAKDLDAPDDPSRDGIVCARREYLERHLCSWTIMAADKLNHKRPDCWPAVWMTLLARWCESRLEQERLEGSGSLNKSGMQ